MHELPRLVVRVDCIVQGVEAHSILGLSAAGRRRWAHVLG